MGMIRCNVVTRCIGRKPGPRASSVGYNWRGVLCALVSNRMGMRCQVMRYAGFGRVDNRDGQRTTWNLFRRVDFGF